MSHYDISESDQNLPESDSQGKERTKFVKVFHGFLTVLLTLLRTLAGFVLIMGGVAWLTRPDSGTHLASELARPLESGTTVGFYVPFLKSVVLPNVEVFARFVGIGELLAGTSLFFGLAHRLGVAGAIFLFANYGLVFGGASLVSHGIMSLIVLAPVLWLTGRKFGIDYWMVRKWPRAKIW